MTGLALELYKPELVSLSEDSHSHFLGVKVVQVQGCHFAGPGRGIIEQMKQDLILIKKTDERLLSPFLGDIEDGFCHLLLFGIFEADHFGKGLEGRKPLIAGLDQVLSLTLKIFKKSND